jgi:hypothetical protein
VHPVGEGGAAGGDGHQQKPSGEARPVGAAIRSRPTGEEARMMRQVGVAIR